MQRPSPGTPFSPRLKTTHGMGEAGWYRNKTVGDGVVTKKGRNLLALRSSRRKEANGKETSEEKGQHEPENCLFYEEQTALESLFGIKTNQSQTFLTTLI